MRLHHVITAAESSVGGRTCRANVDSGTVFINASISRVANVAVTDV